MMLNFILQSYEDYNLNLYNDQKAESFAINTIHLCMLQTVPLSRTDFRCTVVASLDTRCIKLLLMAMKQNC